MTIVYTRICKLLSLSNLSKERRENENNKQLKISPATELNFIKMRNEKSTL